MSEEEKEYLEAYKKMIESDPKGTYRSSIDTAIYNIITKLQKENQYLKKIIDDKEGAEIDANECIKSLRKENKELKQKIKEYEIGKENE